MGKRETSLWKDIKRGFGWDPTLFILSSCIPKRELGQSNLQRHLKNLNFIFFGTDTFQITHVSSICSFLNPSRCTGSWSLSITKPPERISASGWLFRPAFYNTFTEERRTLDLIKAPFILRWLTPGPILWEKERSQGPAISSSSGFLHLKPFLSFPFTMPLYTNKGFVMTDTPRKVEGISYPVRQNVYSFGGRERLGAAPTNGNWNLFSA